MTESKRKIIKPNPDGWIEDHKGTRVFGRSATPESKRRVKKMAQKIAKQKEKRQMGKIVLKDDDLLEYIKQKKTAQQIVDETKVTLLTLQRRVGKLQQSHKKFYDVPGLFEEEAETIKFGQTGIRISKAKLEDFGYQQEDKFELKHDDKKNQITLTKV